MLSRTRVLVVLITLIGTIVLVTNGASVGAMGTGLLLAVNRATAFAYPIALYRSTGQAPNCRYRQGRCVANKQGW